MADSFAADLMVGLVPVQEASSEASFVMGLEYFSPVRTTGSRRVLDVQKSIDRWMVEQRKAGSTATPRYQGRKKLRPLQIRLGMT
ncbi:hypothetical protein [Burkholderia anthina]|uniref:hypothetical protein n=1 Tax=Burkholderia anthina TaxID=179879 RepID=UPI00158B5668